MGDLTTATGPVRILGGQGAVYGPGTQIDIDYANEDSGGLLLPSDFAFFSSKEPRIATSDVSRYYRGDKTWQLLNTSVVPESGTSNLYFTNGRVLAAPLTGLSTGANQAITAADSVLSALGKLQAQLDSLGRLYGESRVLNGDLLLTSTSLRVQRMIANGADRTVTLNLDWTSFSQRFELHNDGASNSIIVKNKDGVQIAVLRPGDHCIVMADNVNGNPGQPSPAMDTNIPNS